MMRGPLVSVIMPTLDGERFIGEALESVIAQSYRPIETIVVDGASSDRTVEIASSFPGVRVVRQRSRGIAGARNEGLAEAAGDFIAFLDHDDVWLPQKLSVQVGFLLSNPSVAGTLSHQEVFVEPGVRPPELMVLAQEQGLDPPPPMSLVIRHQAIEAAGGFDTSYRGADDTDLLLRLRSSGARIENLQDVLMRRRYHGGNYTYDSRTMRAEQFQMLKRHIDRQRGGPR